MGESTHGGGRAGGGGCRGRAGGGEFSADLWSCRGWLADKIIGLRCVTVRLDGGYIERCLPRDQPREVRVVHLDGCQPDLQ
jgi:hypothetical protein